MGGPACRTAGERVSIVVGASLGQGHLISQQLTPIPQGPPLILKVRTLSQRGGLWCRSSTRRELTRTPQGSNGGSSGQTCSCVTCKGGMSGVPRRESQSEIKYLEGYPHVCNRAYARGDHLRKFAGPCVQGVLDPVTAPCPMSLCPGRTCACCFGSSLRGNVYDGSQQKNNNRLLDFHTSSTFDFRFLLDDRWMFDRRWNYFRPTFDGCWCRRELLGRPVARYSAVFVFYRRITRRHVQTIENSICYRTVPSRASGTPCGSVFDRFCDLL